MKQGRYKSYDERKSEELQQINDHIRYSDYLVKAPSQNIESEIKPGLVSKLFGKVKLIISLNLFNL